jgi:ketosteroid isomerase-like protein
VPVSQDDIDFIKRAFVDFGESFESIRSGGVDAYFERLYVPDAVVENVDGFPVPGRYEGLEGYRQFFEDTYGPYDGVSYEVVSIKPVEDRVVVLVRASGRPQEHPVDLEVALGITYEMRGGKIAHVRVYLGHERAVDAARSGG